MPNHFDPMFLVGVLALLFAVFVLIFKKDPVKNVSGPRIPFEPRKHWNRVNNHTGRCYNCPIDNAPPPYIPGHRVTNPCQIDDSKPGDRFQESEGPGAQ